MLEPQPYAPRMRQFEVVRAIAAKEQPRQAIHPQTRCDLPRADPIDQQQSLLLQKLHVDCRLLVLEHVLREPRIRIERWRPPCDFATHMSPEAWSSTFEIDADCFPYRMTMKEEEKRKRLNVLLCCRQLYLEGLSILYSSTLVFEFPLDLYNFQLSVSPEGLSNVKSLIIALGPVGTYGAGPFLSNEKTPKRFCKDTLEEWQSAIHGLKKLGRLQELQIFLGHRHVQSPDLERRPWKGDQKDLRHQRAEERHSHLFNMFRDVQVPEFTIYLTWKPVDILSQREWPFTIQLQTKAEMMHVIDKELPEKIDLDLYDW